MYLHSVHETRSTFDKQPDHQNNQEYSDYYRQIVVQQEDLQFLAQILLENLRAEIPSGKFFQIKCAIQNDQLMILTQHPENICHDPETTFAVLAETLQSMTEHPEQKVKMFLRVIGVKYPYAHRSLTLSKRGVGEKGSGGVCEFMSGRVRREKVVERDYIVVNSSPAPPAPPAPCASLLRAALVIITLLSGGGYFLTRPCVIFECRELQMATQLQRSLRQMIQADSSKSELVKVQQQFETTSTSLNTIPSWSNSYQKAQQLSTSLKSESETIKHVLKAFELESLAQQKNKNTVNSLEELQQKQQKWRRGITHLEVISSNSPLYKLVQPKLSLYRTNLQLSLTQLRKEQKWLKKLEAAKAVAKVAAKRQASAKSLPDWQKVQFTWQVVVNALTVIPQTSPGYSEAQTLLAEYKLSLSIARDRATIELLAAKTYDQAINAANVAKNYEHQNQWEVTVGHWHQALNNVKQIPQDSFYFSMAQPLVEPYSSALKQAEAKLQFAKIAQQTRTDLEKTCSGEIRVCNFTMDNEVITVVITPAYENTVVESDFNTLASVQNHLQTLKQALEAISDNANLAVMVFNSQGQQVYVHLPRG